MIRRTDMLCKYGPQFLSVEQGANRPFVQRRLGSQRRILSATAQTQTQTSARKQRQKKGIRLAASVVPEFVAGLVSFKNFVHHRPEPILLTLNGCTVLHTPAKGVCPFDSEGFHRAVFGS
jgi:hypothetical protein